MNLFCQSSDWFRLPGENLQTTDRRCEQYTTNTARTELPSMITFHHANTRGSRAGRIRIAHLCVPKTIVIHVSCLIPCRAQVQPHPSTSPVFPTVSPAHKISMLHGRLADQHKSHLSHKQQGKKGKKGFHEMEAHEDKQETQTGL